MVSEYRGHELPYVFDLLWDVKTYEQVERIAKFEADCSDADPYDLVELFQKENLEIPECLKGFVQKDDTNNVVKNVTFWSSYCAEGITDYEALKEYEKEKDGAMSTTVTIRDKDINAIVNVFEQESHGQLFFHIHVEGV